MSKKRPNLDVSARRRKMIQKSKVPWGYLIPVIVILVIILGLIFLEFRSPVTTSNVLPPSGNLDFPFPCLAESVVYHVHPWLTITINGKNVTIPAGIGIKNPGQEGTYNGEPIFLSGSCFEPAHTHDDTGIIHIESSSNTNYTLSEFFQIWAATYAYENFSGSEHPIVFNATDILGYQVNSTSGATLKLLVDGQPSTQYGNLVLDTLDYCSSSSSGSPPCSVTAPGSPTWNSGSSYPYGTGHTIVIEYTS